MTKKALNQNGKYAQEFIDVIEPDFIFSTKPINRLKIIETEKENFSQKKIEELSTLKKKLIQLKIVI